MIIYSLFFISGLEFIQCLEFIKSDLEVESTKITQIQSLKTRFNQYWTDACPFVALYKNLISPMELYTINIMDDT